MSNSRFKFRAWEKDLQFMRTFQSHKDGVLYASGDFQVSSGYDSYDEPTFSYDTDDKYIIMQWTGLQDKNGKAVYEDDVIEITASGRICQVVFHKYTAGFDLDYISDPVPGSIRTGLGPEKWKYHVEVIGNIYENPELLK